MSSTLRRRLEIGPREAMSYLREGYEASVLVTASPAVHVLGALLVGGVGFWAGVGVAFHSKLAGVLICGLTLALVAVELLPGLYTLSHRDYASRYLSARLRYGDGRPHLHGFLVLVALPALFFLAFAFGGVAGGSDGSRVAWGLLGAAVGVALGVLRIVHAHVALRRR